MAVQHGDEEPTVEIDAGLDGPTLTIEMPEEAAREEKESGRPWGRWGPRPSVRVAALAIALVVAVSGCVVVDALSVPGADPPAAKLAEWARDHGLGPVVTWFEQVQYQRDQPTVGGTPDGGIPTAAGVETVQAPSTVLPPAPLPPLPGQTPLPGEGVWQTVLTVARRPAVQVTALRPDTQHTSFVVGVLRMDPTLIRGQLHPGTRDPGGTWHTPSIVAGNAQDRLAVAFNGGFRLTDPSHPGYFSEGRTAAPLVSGQASLVLRTDGTADVGTWNQEIQMSPTVASVRQNLQMLVDHGDVNPACATGGTKQWGSTIGQAAYIHRSGFGVTATGVEVYVGGPALSVCTLGNILKAAGVVRGLELDINPNWVSGTYFHPRTGTVAHGYRLFPDERVSPQHYLTTASSRDFYTWSTR
jgi:hypothetical protein